MLPFVFAPAYAEIHYRFRYFFSLLKKREPEIIADVPYRVELSRPWPVLLLIKDAHIYPIHLQRIEVFVDRQKVLARSFDTVIDRHFYETILNVPTETLSPGKKEIAVKIVYLVRGKVKVCLNDNYRTSSKAPLVCTFSDGALPREDAFFYGDLHSHSSFTEDQIEFGASLATMQRMAQAIGLDFFSVTDHSYDLDDLPDNYLVNDPQLRKWSAFRQQVAQLNAHASYPVIIPGEELSVGNHKNQNAHLLVLNNPDFIVGRGDSGEKWFRSKPDHFIGEIPALISKQSLLIPAHSAERVPFVQKLFINRGEWHEADLEHPFFTAIQSINGGSAKETEAGIRQWVRFLLKGHKRTLVAGNDAHGSFARNRHIGIPFVYLRETLKHRFGVWKTGVFIRDFDHRPETILQAIRKGQVFVTNGPFVNLQARGDGDWIPMGGQIGQIREIRIQVRTTHEFGAVQVVRILGGDVQERQESILWQNTFDTNQTFNWQGKISLRVSGTIGYIRCHVTTKTKTERYQAMTNAIYLRKDV